MKIRKNLINPRHMTESATAEQHQPMIVESVTIFSKIPSADKRPPSAAILLEAIEPLQKTACAADSRARSH
jgi:hypothetical protein